MMLNLAFSPPQAQDAQWMHRALALAEKGLWTTSPNPRVGCVIVDAQQNCVGEGWHEKAGQAHAEVMALRQAGLAARGATAYVTLEPCAHFGRTPPCAQALIQAGVSRVVAALQDPNPLVAGKGFAQLIDAGISCTVGVERELSHELNIGFIQRMTHARPWVRLKAAASLDGRTALADGRSQWITSSEARQDGQLWRARACAILTGVGTVLADNPQMNVRLPGASRQPWRVVVDSHFRTPPAAQIVNEYAWIIGTHPNAEREAALQARGARTLHMPGAGGRVDLNTMLTYLAEQQINELHVEAGSVLNGALIAQACVDEILLYLAPKLLGHTAQALFQFPALSDLNLAPALSIKSMAPIGPDWRALARTKSLA